MTIKYCAEKMRFAYQINKERIHTHTHTHTHIHSKYVILLLLSTVRNIFSTTSVQREPIFAFPTMNTFTLLISTTTIKIERTVGCPWQNG
jgi:hypothetical protein